MKNPPHIDVFISMPYVENCYIVWREGSSDCLVVDPGFEADQLLDRIQSAGLRVVLILNTHGHVDHIAGNDEIKRAFPEAPIVIGKGDAVMLADPTANLSAFSGEPITSPPADRLVLHGEFVESLGMTLEVRDLPGHSPGHVVYVWHDGDPIVVFGGDTLFQGSVGRVDFPGGDGPTLIRGIHEQLYSLPETTIILPGHGDRTTVGAERATNPFTLGLIPM